MRAMPMQRTAMRDARRTAPRVPSAAPVRSAPPRAGLDVSVPGDPWEREADRVADAVLRAPAEGAAADVHPAPAGVQRCAACAGGTPCAACAAREAEEEEEPVLRREADGAAPRVTPAVEARVRAAAGAGAPLPHAVRGFFEPRLGRGLGGVRVHTDARADEAARAVHARAFTLGRDVVFRAGAYAPQTAAGRRLLAHELVHVVQQGGGSAPTALHPAASAAPRVHASGPRIARQATDAPFTIVHTGGTTFEVPGLRQGQGAFGASGATLSQLRPVAPRAGRPVTGGFADPLSLEAGYGLRAETVPAADVDALVSAAGSRVPAALAPTIREVARDRFVFRALRTFLERDRGRFEAWPSSGNYDGASPPRIAVGTDGGPAQVRTTFFHELLHYVLDRMDSDVGEGVNPGGADHPLIEALEQRFVIVELIRSGQPPLGPALEHSFGAFIRNGDVFPQMQAAISGNDGPALLRIVDDPGFVATVVRSGVLSEAASVGSRPAGQYQTDEAGFRDLAFIHAQNAVLVRRAMREAVAIALRLGVPLRDVFAREEWRREMDGFIRGFVAAVGRDPTQDVVALEPTVTPVPEPAPPPTAPATPATPAAPRARRFRQQVGIGAGGMEAGGRTTPLISAAWQARFGERGSALEIPLEARLLYGPSEGLLGTATAGAQLRIPRTPLRVGPVAGLGVGQVQVPGATPETTERRGAFGPVVGIGAGAELGSHVRVDLRYERLLNVVNNAPDVNLFGVTGAWEF